MIKAAKANDVFFNGRLYGTDLTQLSESKGISRWGHIGAIKYFSCC